MFRSNWIFGAGLRTGVSKLSASAKVTVMRIWLLLGNRYEVGSKLKISSTGFPAGIGSKSLL
ncbi:MAG: hypothetical protein FJ115_05815 [Deltaproteobacteria bacterium]|nr:hypothetical protein [Deltaproteobacteria bacterium]